MDKQALMQHLAAHGLQNYAQAAAPFARQAITLTAVPAEAMAVGASRLGGEPDLPDDMAWPYAADKPMALIAQINFAEAKPFDADNRLPESGILYLFYEAEEQPWGFDPKDKSGFQVAYYAGDNAALQRRTAPADWAEYCRFSAAALRFGSRTELPDSYSFLMRDYAMDDDENDAWWYWRGEQPEPFHKLLGHSDNIQGDMELECQLVSHGLYCGNSSGYEDPRRAELEAGAGDWVLLLQIDSEEAHCGMMWGDSGRLYLWIRQQDLAAKAFERCWLVLQCY